MTRTGLRYLLAVALTLLVLFGMLAALPHAIRYGLEHQLGKQGLQAEIQNIDLNLFTRTAVIENAQGSNKQGRGFRLQRLQFGWRYLPLWQKRLMLTHLDISGLDIDVAPAAEPEQAMEIAGLGIAPADRTQSGNGWGFGLQTANVTATSINYIDPALRQRITIKASSIRDVASWAQSQPIVISSESSIAGGELLLQGQIQPFSNQISLTLHVQAQNLPLAPIAPLLPTDMVRIDGLLHADMAVEATYSADAGLAMDIQGDGRLRHYQVGLQTPALDIGGDLTHWQGKLALQKPVDAPVNFHGDGKLAASQMRVTDRRQQTDLLYLASVDIPVLTITAADEFHSDGLLVGAGFALIDQSADPQAAEPIARWEGIQAAGIRYQAAALAMESISLAGLHSRLVRNAEGSWNLTRALQQSLPASAEAAPEGPPPLRIGSLNIDNGSRIAIRDASVSPAFLLDLTEVQAQLQTLDNQQPDQPSPLQLSAKVGDYGELALAGSLRPFSNPPAADLQGKISGIDTVPLSGYAQRLLGHRIRQGTVSGDLDINIEQGRLASSLDLVLNKLQIAATKDAGSEFETSTGMPLVTALNLMRDRDENIRLKLPIKGEANNPDIDLNDIIRKAVFKGIQTAVLAFYSPLGVISATDKLIRFATALRFDPIAFAANSAELDTKARADLARLTDTLLQRPKLQITLCGMAVPADRQLIADEIAAQNSRFFGLMRPEADPATVPQEQLVALARQRMRSVGDYMREHGIAAGQLILCDGEISDDPGARPGVSIRL